MAGIWEADFLRWQVSERNSSQDGRCLLEEGFSMGMERQENAFAHTGGQPVVWDSYLRRVTTKNLLYS
ncbi:hypothetical protein J6590_095515 [Homalodisca vitripennis]|nr:hypothetical protein J6590_095515 [Homalodisca vitripennis]